MKFTKLQMVVPALMIISVFGLTPSRALAKQEGKTKVKSTEKTTTKENSGRRAGELPSGLQKYTDQKGQLPIRVAKDPGRRLPPDERSENGGKKLQSNAKVISLPRNRSLRRGSSPLLQAATGSVIDPLTGQDPAARQISKQKRVNSSKSEDRG